MEKWQVEVMGRQLQSPDSVATVAVRSWFDLHAHELARYLARRLGPDQVEDALSDIFERALTSHSRFATRDVGPRPWLYGIAVRVIQEQRRAQHKRLQLLQRVAATGEFSSTDALPSDTTAVDPELMRRVRSLPKHQRETLLLMAWGELSYEECAVALDVSIGTVRSRISRARKALQDIDTPHLPEEHRVS